MSSLGLKSSENCEHRYRRWVVHSRTHARPNFSSLWRISIVRSLRGRVGITYISFTLNPHHPQIVLGIAQENQLELIEAFGEEAKPITLVHIMRPLLSEIREIADPAIPVD